MWVIGGSRDGVNVLEAPVERRGAMLVGIHVHTRRKGA